MKLGKFLKALWDDDRGQSTTEYILMLSVVVMIAMKFRKMFDSKMESAVQTLGGQIEGALNGGSD
ncbi:MAG: hypothetical protein NDJ89_00860 [Oligoflexia bacterium]|nr:hypothetical protein [Oligoflexia bacterium]